MSSRRLLATLLRTSTGARSSSSEGSVKALIFAGRRIYLSSSKYYLADQKHLKLNKSYSGCTKSIWILYESRSLKVYCLMWKAFQVCIKMFALSASVIPNSTSQLAKSELQSVTQSRCIGLSSSPLRPISIQPSKYAGQKHMSKRKSSAFICVAALWW